ncbi:MAG: hypothetical protein WC455_28045 [Dehalococcoidia bacterium]|jgi:hypothetical protein
MKAIPAIMEKRKLLSEIFKWRNEAVKALNLDDREQYNFAISEMNSRVMRLELVP